MILRESVQRHIVDYHVRNARHGHELIWDRLTQVLFCDIDNTMGCDSTAFIIYCLRPNDAIESTPEDMLWGVSAQYEHVVLIVFKRPKQKLLVNHRSSQLSLGITHEDRQLIALARGVCRFHRLERPIGL